MPDHSSDQSFFFIANYLCLDFINTQIAESGRPVDLLKSFGDLVSWCVQARVLETTQQKALFIFPDSTKSVAKITAPLACKVADKLIGPIAVSPSSLTSPAFGETASLCR